MFIQETYLQKKYKTWHRSFRYNWDLYLILIPVIAYFIIFHYIPMYGVQIAFRRYSFSMGITGSTWVGLFHFERFFKSYYCWRLIKNTLTISAYSLIIGFPIPIFLAIMINENPSVRFKKLVQTITYAPHFLSTVVIVSLLNSFLDVRTGFLNIVLQKLGADGIKFLTEPAWFKTIYVFSGVWQNMGWSSIIYVAALSGIDPTFYEAGRVDGATRIQMMKFITIPALLPTATIMLILSFGSLMSVGFEKVFLMQNDLNISASDIISTYVYRSGLINSEYSFSSAVGLFNSVINCILLITVNKIAKQMSGHGLW